METLWSVLIKTPLAHKWAACKQRLIKFSWKFPWGFLPSGPQHWSGSQFAPEIDGWDRFRKGDPLLSPFLLWRELSRQASGLWLKLHAAILMIGACFLTQYTEEWLNSYKVRCFLHIIFLQWATKPINSSFNFQVQISPDQWELTQNLTAKNLFEGKLKGWHPVHLNNSYGFFRFLFNVLSQLNVLPFMCW